jgi:serine/threonine protein kinase
MLAGTRPFSRAAAVGIDGEIFASVPAPLPPDVEISPELQHVIQHCLEKDPSARFQSARDVAFVLEFTLRAPQAVQRQTPPRGRLASVLRRL